MGPQPLLRTLIVMPSAVMRGGAEETLLQVARHGREAGLELTIAFLEDGGLIPTFANTGVCVALIPAGRLRSPLRFIQTVGALVRLIRDGGFDIVLGWMTKAHIYSGLAAWKCGVPALYFQHGLPDWSLVDRLSRLVPATAGLACSGFAASEQRKFVRHPVFGVPVSADLERFRAASHVSISEQKARLGFFPTEQLVGIVGRLQRWKGMHVFVEAVAQVARRFPSCQAVIVGGRHEHEPDYEEFLRRMILGRGLEGCLRMAGRQEDVPTWMGAMDVVVHASSREPFGLVVVEAMAMGKPVVATIPGGPGEIIVSGETGLLVPEGDPEALAGAISKFLSEPQFAGRCGAGAANSVGIYSPQRFASRLADVLLRFAKGNHEKGRRMRAQGDREMPAGTSFYLDALRVIAAALVFLNHAVSQFHLGDQQLWEKIGQGAVVIFFVLSGYLIAYTTFRRATGLRDYSIARLSRLYSVLAPALILTACLQFVGSRMNPSYYADISRGHDGVRYLLSLLFLQNLWFFSASPPTNGPLWSLCYEFWYYAIFGAAFLIRNRLASLLAVLACLAIAGPNILLLAPCWIMGAAIFFLGKKMALPRKVALGAWIASAALLAAGIFFYSHFPFKLGKFPLYFSGSFGFDWLLAGLAAISIFFFDRSMGRGEWLNERVARGTAHIAGHTYSLYLYHVPLMIFAAAVLSKRHCAWWESALVLALILAGIYALSLFTEGRRNDFRWFFKKLIPVSNPGKPIWTG